MKIRRGIFGGALLFAAAGCTGTSSKADVSTPADAASDAALKDAAEDTTPKDTSATDSGSADAQMADVKGDSGSDDTSGNGGGGTTVDASAISDTQLPDADTGDIVEDTLDTEDVWVAMDSTPPEDVADAGTSQCQLLTVDNALGEKCSDPMTAICDPDNPQDVALLCHNTTWQKMSELSQEYPFGCFCEQSPDPCQYAFAACAVPGFVGLDRAGRIRSAPRKLRLV